MTHAHHDSLGSRMKTQYEVRSQQSLPRRTYSIIRLDGRAFHTFTRPFKKPYDLSFIACLDNAVGRTLPEIQGAEFAYVQSDEVSILLTDFKAPETQAWFDGNVQKITSVSASILTGYFVDEIFSAALKGLFNKKDINSIPSFDSRVFTVPDSVEVENYFIWRQQDAQRNSVSMLAQHYASQKELNGKNLEAQHKIINANGDEYAKHPAGFRNGRVITRETIVAAGNFTEDRAELINRIPKIWG